MVKRKDSFWDKHGFTIYIISSILIICVAYIFRKRVNRLIDFYNREFGTLINKDKRRTKTSSYTNPNIDSNGQTQCSYKDSKGEIECKRVLESLLGLPFTKVRPEFLNNDVTFQNLELDMYNEDLKLAVEYSGQQHYKYTPHFHKNKEAFRNQQYRDYMKRQKCKEHGVMLIEVPYTVKHGDIEGYLRDKLSFLV